MQVGISGDRYLQGTSLRASHCTFAHHSHPRSRDRDASPRALARAMRALTRCPRVWRSTPRPRTGRWTATLKSLSPALGHDDAVTAELWRLEEAKNRETGCLHLTKNQCQLSRGKIPLLRVVCDRAQLDLFCQAVDPYVCSCRESDLLVPL